jgi:hypothetical protein
MAVTIGAVALAAGVVALVISALVPNETTLTFRIRDAVSKQWVWDASVTLQGREVKAYFQSDSGLRDYTFTNLEPGTWEIEARAPHYQSRTIEVDLRRGENALEEPIELTGYEIPNLARFVAFESFEGRDVVTELRPVSVSGRAVEQHPCLDIWVGARVSVQVKDGVPVRRETTSGSDRGAELFRGELDWSWHPEPERVYRYSARIPGAEIMSSPAPFWVIDYLIMVPDPREITRAELADIAAEAWSRDNEGIMRYLRERAEGRFEYYFATSWNVAGGRQ